MPGSCGCLPSFAPKANLDGLVRPSTACRTLLTAQQLSAGIKTARPTVLDVNDAQALDAAVAQHDLVISLIPYTFHAKVIQSAIRQKKHVVTTSYVSPAMLELDAAAKEAGITVMNEIGLDPGSKQHPDIICEAHQHLPVDHARRPLLRVANGHKTRHSNLFQCGMSLLVLG